MTTLTVERPPNEPLLPDGARLGGWWRLGDEPDRIVCELCPRRCALKPGDRGFCFVRENRDGRMVLNTYGRSTGFCIDPIEKKPLNHFFPGTSVLSFGTAGCNLGCKFCQNHDISKAREVALLSERATPAMIADAARQLGCQSVAYTYNDPVIWAEYAIDTARACRAAGVQNVAVTAGYITPEARGDFFAFMDAANVDLKAFTEEFYQHLTLSHLAPVLDTLQWLRRETDVWFEITNLVIPGENDRDDEFRRMCAWIAAELGPETPVHFTAFHPDYKMLDHPPTPLATLLRAHEIARSLGLKHVYVGNVNDAAHQSTYCAACGQLLIERDWYQLGQYHLRGDQCAHCGARLVGRFAARPGDWGARRLPVRIADYGSPRLEPDVVALTPPPASSATSPTETTTMTAAAPTFEAGLPHVSPEQSQALHHAASQLVAAAILGHPPHLADPTLAGLAERPVLGAFVSLKRQGKLRACCGLIGEQLPVATALARAAERTAQEDHRLPPISPTELPHLDLEVWLLGPLRPVTARGADRLAAVEIGRHGLKIVAGDRQGLLLPSVAIDHQLDAEGFLQQVCLKAGLDPTAWQDDAARLFTFEGREIAGPLELDPAELQLADTPALLSDEELSLLVRFARENVALLLEGATPNYYLFGCRDANVAGVALVLRQRESEAEVPLLKLSLRPGVPLQATLFSLAEAAAQQLAMAGFPAHRLGEFDLDLAVLYDPAMHGVLAEPDLRGFDSSRRGLLAIERNRNAWRFAPEESNDELLAAVRHALQSLTPREASLFSLRVQATRTPLAVQHRPAAAAGPNVRPPAVAGSFYPAEPAELARLVDELSPVDPPPVARWRACLTPHAGLRYSGRLAADVLARVEIPDTVIVLGPKHTPDGVDWAVAPHDAWQIPGATIAADPVLARELAETIEGLQLDAAAHAREHAIEVELPFLARLAPAAKVVGVAIGAGSLPECQHFAAGLADVLRRRTERVLLVVSSDMNHFANDAETRRLDALALERLDALDPEGLYDVCRRRHISMCGLLPATIVLLALRELGQLDGVEAVGYATSADVTGDTRRVVGYAGRLFGRG